MNREHYVKLKTEVMRAKEKMERRWKGIKKHRYRRFLKQMTPKLARIAFLDDELRKMEPKSKRLEEKPRPPQSVEEHAGAAI